MQALNIVIAQNDPAVAAMLASSLDRYFRSVRLARSLDELRSAIPKGRPDAVVADLETVTLEQVHELTAEFQVPVVCTHRLPDESMWTAALSAGAIDICQNSDVDGITEALKRNRFARSTAA
jgi:DNA-binding NtrC family response regulator